MRFSKVSYSTVLRNYIVCKFFQIQYNFTTNKCKNGPSNVQNWDSNTWPLDYKSPPITTWPRLRPYLYNALFFLKNGPFPASFEFIFIFSAVNGQNVPYKILLMTRFELGTSGIRSNCSAKWVIHNALIGREPLSSGQWRWLTIRRLWVWIQYWMNIFTLICCKIV